MPAIDIDRDTAHEAAQRELAKPIYPKASLTERLSEWLEDLLYRIAQEGSRLPGGWFTVTLLLIMAAIAIVVAVRIARRTMRTNRGGEHALVRPVLTADEHALAIHDDSLGMQCRLHLNLAHVQAEPLHGDEI